MRNPGADWRRTFRRRLQVAVAALAIWAVGIEVRLVYLQVIKHDEMVARADRQHKRTIPAPAKRGDILDRNGQVLATSLDADTIYAAPSVIGPDLARAVARRLCQALEDCDAAELRTLTDRLGRTRDHFAHVRRQVSPDVAQRVKDLNLDGVGTFKESKRHYPNGDLGAAVIGFVGTENRGLAGLEHAYNRQIRGEDGRVLIQNDAKGRVFSRFSQPPTSGSSLELTIDRYLQHITESALEAGVSGSRAAGGCAIIMDPRTGEILAMANAPTFDPNIYNRSSETARRNRCVQDVYEPGSTFKVVTASAAIEEKVMPPGSIIETGPGRVLIGRRVIDEYRGHNYGALSFEDVIVKSSNVGAVKIGFRIGTDRLSRYVDLFGFGRRVSPDFPGENPGIVWSADSWTEGALASVSMGYQVGVTPLQVVAAVAAVANGGQYVEPRIVRASDRGDTRQTVKTKVLRRVISESTAATMTGIMERVVEDGTAKAAAIPGYTVAGKTGTAEKLVNGRYSPTENNVSFVGFVPSRKPALAIIVMIDAPHEGGNSGGSVAAPVFRTLAEPALRHLAVPGDVNPQPPIMINAAVREPARVPTKADFKEPPEVPIVVGASVGPAMPDLIGLSAREAMGRVSEIGMDPHLTGDGEVVSQSPAAGAPIGAGGVVQLMLSRVPLRTPRGSAAQP
jgi:cell division protein FtsI (penicillin-binding protein 3)